jgi:hypothetical protein
MLTGFGFFLLVTAQSFAMNIGSKSVLAGDGVDKWGNKSRMISENEFLANEGSRYLAKRSYSIYDENGSLRETGSDSKWEPIYYGWLPDGKSYSSENIQRRCDYDKGVIEIVTVPAGTFKTCKVDYSYGGTRGSEWFGPVPFSVVKRKTQSQWFTSETVLQKYNE